MQETEIKKRESFRERDTENTRERGGARLELYQRLGELYPDQEAAWREKKRGTADQPTSGLLFADHACKPAA